jgi:DNA-binding IclR family transcriptional regulator
MHGRSELRCDQQRFLNLRSSGKMLAAIAGELKMSKTSVARMLVGLRKHGAVSKMRV